MGTVRSIGKDYASFIYILKLSETHATQKAIRKDALPVCYSNSCLQQLKHLSPDVLPPPERAHPSLGPPRFAFRRLTTKASVPTTRHLTPNQEYKNNLCLNKEEIFLHEFICAMNRPKPSLMTFSAPATATFETILKTDLSATSPSMEFRAVSTIISGITGLTTWTST